MILIEVNAIRRSGHHAFINWLISNIHGVRYEENLCKLKYNTIVGNKNILWVNEGEQDTNNVIERITNNLNGIDIIIISYEAPTHDTLINPNYSLLTDRLKEKWGVTEHIQVPFVRDFYNNFASLSKLKYMHHLFNSKSKPLPNTVLDRYIHLHKHQLKRVLTTFRGIIYDKWIGDKEYTNEVCLKLIGQPNKFSPLEIGGTPSSYGGGQLKLESLLTRYKKTKWPKWMIDGIKGDVELSELISKAGFDKSDIEIQES